MTSMLVVLLSSIFSAVVTAGLTWIQARIERDERNKARVDHLHLAEPTRPLIGPAGINGPSRGPVGGSGQAKAASQTAPVPTWWNSEQRRQLLAQGFSGARELMWRDAQHRSLEDR